MHNFWTGETGKITVEAAANAKERRVVVLCSGSTLISLFIRPSYLLCIYRASSASPAFPCLRRVRLGGWGRRHKPLRHEPSLSSYSWALTGIMSAAPVPLRSEICAVISGMAFPLGVCWLSSASATYGSSPAGRCKQNAALARRARSMAADV